MRDWSRMPPFMARENVMKRSQRITCGILKASLARWVLLILAIGMCLQAEAQTTRTLSGVVVTDRDESVPGASIIVRYASGEIITITDAAGKFSLPVPDETL